MSYRLSDFDYELPDGLIAQKPSHPRDHARLLVYDRQTGTITDDYFYNLGDYLSESTTLVVNNSKVEKCRLLFDRGALEIFIVNQTGDRTVEAMVRPGKKFKEGVTLSLTSDITAEVINIAKDGIRTIALNYPMDDPVYDPFRVTPFPPYIKQDESLSDQYQTIFASDPGSKAAPTAGLHFTDGLIEKLKKNGFGWEEVTLHVGLGTFAPVKTDNPDNHTLHSEWYRLDETTANRLSQSSHITAVGTTSVRVLETAGSNHSGFRSSIGETDIFIRPGYSFTSTDSLITNFHLPKSTLLMLVAAFMGFQEMKNIYSHAIKEKYRFYSFGDGMLIL